MAKQVNETKEYIKDINEIEEEKVFVDEYNNHYYIWGRSDIMGEDLVVLVDITDKRFMSNFYPDSRLETNVGKLIKKNIATKLDKLYYLTDYSKLPKFFSQIF